MKVWFRNHVFDWLNFLWSDVHKRLNFLWSDVAHKSDCPMIVWTCSFCILNNSFIFRVLDENKIIESDSRKCRLILVMYLLTEVTYLLTVEHRPSTSPRHCTLSWATLAISVHLVPCCFSSASLIIVSPPTVARLASLPLWVLGQGLACGAGGWLPEGVSIPALLFPQYLLCHLFLSHSLPQIFISDLLLPLILEMRFRQVLKNVWIFCCIVCVFHLVSHLKSRLDFTLELKMQSLVLMLIPPDAEMFSSMMKAALTSPVLDPCLPVGQPPFPGRWKIPPPW